MTRNALTEGIISSPALSQLSVEYLRGRPKSERSSLGQFLTPRELRESLVSRIPLESGMRVLDPGVGTGEFLKTCSEFSDGLLLHGWDIDKPVLEVAQQLIPDAKLENRSALDTWQGEQFDVVVGNPPYYEMRGINPSLRKDFARVISGRPNIFALFFEAGWRVLKPGGYLGYVVPPSMNNGAYFERLREFLLDQFSIEYFKVFDDPNLFEEVQTAVQLIVLRKGHSSDRNWIDLGEISGSPISRKVFVENPEAFRELFFGKSTIYSLGYQAVTGTVVWNTRKSDLRAIPEVGVVPLIWAHNISLSREILLNEEHPKRPQYVLESRTQTGPAIVVNRITGTVGSGSLRCALVPPGMKFVGENHVNVIVPRKDVDQKASWSDLLDALRAPGVNQRVRFLTGNTQISATELTNWIPLDL